MPTARGSFFFRCEYLTQCFGMSVWTPPSPCTSLMCSLTSFGRRSFCGRRLHARAHTPGFGDIYSVQLSVTPTDERTCVTDTCSISTEDPFPLCFSRTTSNNNNSPHSWAVFPGSSSPPPGVITQCAPPPPVSTGGFGLPPGACPRAHTRPLPFSRNRHALLLSYLTVSALSPLTRPALSSSP